MAFNVSRSLGEMRKSNGKPPFRTTERKNILMAVEVEIPKLEKIVSA